MSVLRFPAYVRLLYGRLLYGRLFYRRLFFGRMSYMRLFTAWALSMILWLCASTPLLPGQVPDGDPAPQFPQPVLTTDANPVDLSGDLAPPVPAPVSEPGTEIESESIEIKTANTKAKQEQPTYRTSQEQLKAKLNQKGSITLRDATLNEALFYIRKEWDVSVVFSNDLQGEVNAVFTEEPLYEILDTLLFSRGYGYRIVGSSLVIMKREDIKGMDPLFETQTVSVKHGDVNEIEATISQLGFQSPHGKIIPIPTAKAILIMDYPDQIKRIRDHIESLEGHYREISQAQAAAAQPAGTTQTPDGETVVTPPAGPSMEMGFFKAYHVSTELLTSSLELLASEEGSITTIAKENRIVVLDYPANLERIRQAIKELDVPRPQVRIWALIYDASLDDVKRIGVNWQNAVKGRNLGTTGVAQDQISVNSLTATAPAAASPNGGLTFMSLNTNFDVTAVVNALNSSKNSRLLANPQVTVLDKELAKIAIVTEIPFQQLTQGGNSGGPIGTTAFREAGVSMEVTPKISDNGWIEMLVNPKFSLLTGFTQQSNQPIIDRREASTTVWIPSGETFVIGGLRQRQANHEGAGIPILQDMRFGFSFLFRNRQSTIRESELLVFITPEIISAESRQLACREAIAFDYGRLTLDRISPPPAPDIHAMRPVEFRDEPLQNGVPVNPTRDPVIGPITTPSAPVVAPQSELPRPVQVQEEAARLNRNVVSPPLISRQPVRRLPPVGGFPNSAPANEYPAVNTQYSPSSASRVHPVAAASALLPVANDSTGVSAPVAPSASVVKKPPKTVWEAIKRRK